VAEKGEVKSLRGQGREEALVGGEDVCFVAFSRADVLVRRVCRREDPVRALEAAALPPADRWFSPAIGRALRLYELFSRQAMIRGRGRRILQGVRACGLRPTSDSPCRAPPVARAGAFY